MTDRPDRLSEVAGNPLKPDSLVGAFFHSGYERGWQGCIVAEPSEGIYLVELFSWIAGESTNQLLVPIEIMLTEKWQFYDDAEWMKNTYEVGGLKRQWDREREEADKSDS